MDDAEIRAQALIIVNGSSLMKAGFAGDDAPRAVFPSLVGRPCHSGVRVSMHHKDAYIGDEAQSKRGILTLKYPIEFGIVTNWDDTEKMWHHTFYNELRVAPEEHPILLTEVASNPKRNREKCAEICFEAFYVPYLYLANRSVLSLLSSGRTTGCVLEVGDSLNAAVPIVEGRVLRHAVKQHDFAGRGLTSLLVKLLSNRGFSFNTSAEFELVRDIKHRLGRVAVDFESETNAAIGSKDGYDKKDDYENPSGQCIPVLTVDQLKCGEALFQPNLAGSECVGVHQLVADAISDCEVDLRQEMYANVILSGGSTMFPGFPERLSKELSSQSQVAKVVAKPERKFATWHGGSMFVTQDSLTANCWASKEQYEEVGPSIVHRKFF